MPIELPKNLPVLPYESVADIPQDVLDDLKEAHEADQQQAREEAYDEQSEAAAEVYNEQRDTTFSPANRVQCPIQGYEQLYVTYDLTRNYFYRFSKPRFESSMKVPAAAKDAELWDDMEVLEKDFNRWMKRRAKWVRRFIQNIEGWPEIADANGDLIPHPMFGAWQSYYDLFLQAPDVAEWIAEGGYETAMKESLKNS